MANIPSNNNINDIINSGLIDERVNKLIISTVMDIINFSEKLDKKSISKSINNMKLVAGLVENYINIMNNIIKTLTTELPGGKNLTTLLGFEPEKIDEINGKKIVKKERWMLVEAVQQISTILEHIFKGLETASNFNNSMKSAMTIKSNIMFAGEAFKDIINMLYTTFSDMSNDPIMKNIIGTLVSEPSTIEHIINKTDKSQESKEFTNKNITELDKTITKNGKLGLLDVIDKIFSLLGVMTNIKTPNLIKFKIQILIMKHIFNQVINMMYDLSKSWSLEVYKKTLSEFGLLIGGENGIVRTIKLLKTSVDELSKGFNLKYILSIKIISLGISIFKDTLDQILSIIKGDGKKTSATLLADKRIQDKLSKLKKSISIFGETFTIVSELVKPMNNLRRFKRSTLKGLDSFVTIVKNIAEKMKDLDEIELINPSILNELNEVVDELVNVSKKIVIFSLLSPFILLATISASLGVLGIIAFVTVVSWLTKLINKNITIDIVSSIKNISIILSSFIIIGFEMIAFALMKDIILLSIIAATIAITAIIAFTLVVATEFWLISKIMPTMKLNMMSFGMLIGLIAMTLITASLTLLLMSLIASQVISKVGVIFGLIGVITAVLIAISILGYTATFVAPALLGLLGITVAIACIFSIVLMLRILEEIKLDQKSIINNVDSVFDTVTVILGRLFKRKKVEKNGDTDGDPRNDALKHGPMSGIFTIVKSLLGCVTLFMTLVSVTSILIIATQLRILQTLNLDSKTIIDNVDSIFRTSTYIIENLFYRKEDNSQSSNKPFIWKVISWIGGPIANIAEAIMAVAFLATTILAVGMIQILALQLKGISNTTIPNDIDEKVSSIITSAKKLIEKVLSPVDDAPEASDKQKKGLRGVISNIFPNLSGMIDALTTSGILATSLISVGLISCLANNLNNIASITFTANIIEDKTKTIIECANKVNKLINSSTLTESSKNININKLIELNKELSKLTEIPDKNVINTEKILNNYTEFIKKINTIKVENLEKTTKMFKQMSQFSDSINGNFDKLAESLNEKLMPVLEELKEIMSSVPDKLDNGFANTSKSIITTSQTPISQSTMTQQVQMENPNISKDELDRIVKTRLNEQARMQSNSITSKIDELLDLLSTGKIKVITV